MKYLFRVGVAFFELASGRVSYEDIMTLSGAMKSESMRVDRYVKGVIINSDLLHYKRIYVKF
jgi:hypothetical protein